MRHLREAQSKPIKAYDQSYNIIPLWRSMIPNMVSETCPKLMSIESSNFEQRIVSLEGVVKSDESIEQKVYYVRGL